MIAHMQHIKQKAAGIGFLLLLCLLPAVGRAQVSEVPADMQFLLFTKILSFDRSLESRGRAGELRIGILFQDKQRASLREKDAFVSAIKASPVKEVGGLKIAYVLIPWNDGQTLEQAMDGKYAHVLYVTPLRAVELEDVLLYTRGRKILSLTGVPSYCDQGVSVGVELTGDKPSIIVNLEASRWEGANFSSQLLKMARIIE